MKRIYERREKLSGNAPDVAVHIQKAGACRTTVISMSG
jgi:hypothetical protein